jgi:hypothetical protein
LSSSTGHTPALLRLKQELKHRLLHAAGVRRIHIVGCARSGTTMLHYALVAFADTMILHDAETKVWMSPSIRDCMNLVRRYAFDRRPRFLLTKRNARWHLPDEVARIIYSTRMHGMFLINIVRDPRDVLTSHMDGREGFYVELERWQRSVEATERILEALTDHPRILTVRYEDVVGAPDRTGAMLEERLRLRFRPGVRSFADLEANVAQAGQTTGRATMMHGVRPLSTSSIGRWRQDPAQRAFVGQVLAESAQRDVMRRFMTAHGYALEEQPDV